jgi:hypothetical protein
MKKMFTVFVSLLALSGLFAAEYGRVNILDFKEFAANIGTDREDWSPAFEKAVAQAYATTRCLYVPAGDYPLQKAVEIWKEPTGAFVGGLTLMGDGRYASMIIQKNPKENAINWTGKTYKGSLNGGTIKDIGISGGAIGLNIKWHNQFTLQSCYVAGASEAGIWSEGYSNRFIDIVVRHCPKIGFRGSAHFNDVTIRDGYFSRDGIGIWMGSGARGVRISGIGFEHTVKCAIYIARSFAISISDCYFEGNALSPQKDWFLNGSIVLDHHADSIQVQNCIFRGTSVNRGHVVIGDSRNVEVSGNLIQIHRQDADALVMLADPMDGKTPAHASSIFVRNNRYIWSSKMAKTEKGAPPYCYFEVRPGMVQEAVRNGSIFESAEKTRVISGDAGQTRTGAEDFN